MTWKPSYDAYALSTSEPSTVSDSVDKQMQQIQKQMEQSQQQMQQLQSRIASAPPSSSAHQQVGTVRTSPAWTSATLHAPTQQQQQQQPQRIQQQVGSYGSASEKHSNVYVMATHSEPQRAATPSADLHSRQCSWENLKMEILEEIETKFNTLRSDFISRLPHCDFMNFVDKQFKGMHDKIDGFTGHAQSTGSKFIEKNNFTAFSVGRTTDSSVQATLIGGKLPDGTRNFKKQVFKAFEAPAAQNTLTTATTSQTPQIFSMSSRASSLSSCASWRSCTSKRSDSGS